MLPSHQTPLTWSPKNPERRVGNTAGATDTETKMLSRRITDAHPADVTNLACLIHMSKSLFTAYESATGAAISPLLTLQRNCILAWIEQEGISRVAVRDALASFERAAETIGYLDTLPL